MKRLGFDDFIARLRAVAGALPDPRTGDHSRYSMAEIALAACSVFFTQCPSFLNFQRNMEQSRARNKARSLFHVQAIPSDNHLCQTLDSVAPEHLMELFDESTVSIFDFPRVVGGWGLFQLTASPSFTPCYSATCPLKTFCPAPPAARRAAILILARSAGLIPIQGPAP